MYFFIFILFQTDIPVSKQWRPWSDVASDLGLHCLPTSQNWDSRLVWVNKNNFLTITSFIKSSQQKEYSCINIYAHSCLKPLPNPLKAVFKQLKPCLNHGIHVLFEHGFYLQTVKTGHRLFMWRQTTMQGSPRISILSWFLLTLPSFHFLRMMSEKAKNKMASTDVYSIVKATFSWFFRLFDGSFHGIM